MLDWSCLTTTWATRLEFSCGLWNDRQTLQYVLRVSYLRIVTTSVALERTYGLKLYQNHRLPIGSGSINQGLDIPPNGVSFLTYYINDSSSWVSLVKGFL